MPTRARRSPTSGVVNGPLEALASPAVGGNGVFRYGAQRFPNQTLQRDQLLGRRRVRHHVATDTTAPTVVDMTPSAGSGSAAVAAPVTATFSEALGSASVVASSMELRDAAQAIVPATVGYDVSTHTATLQPQAPLAFDTSYTATVRGGSTGVRDLAGNALAASHTWTFTTEGPTLSITDVTIAESTSAVNAVLHGDTLGGERPLGDRQLRDSERHRVGAESITRRLPGPSPSRPERRPRRSRCRFPSTRWTSPTRPCS